MPTYLCKARNTSAITEVTVDADSREAAILQIVNTAKEGEQMEVMSCVEQVVEGTPTKASKADKDHR